MEKFITLSEAEKLIFEKYIKISETRNVINARDQFSIKIEFDEKYLINLNDGFIYILFSSVNSFEIPEKDKSLFINHFYIPEGLIVTKDRKYKDDSNQVKIDHNSAIKNTNYYTFIRNGLIGVYKEFLLNKKLIDDFGFLNNFLSEFQNISNFKKIVFKEIIKNDTKFFYFPLLKFDPNTFRADKYYRVAWFLKFVNDNLIKNTNNNEQQNLSVKEWFKELLTSITNEKLSYFFNTIPNLLEKEKHIIFGYLFVAFNFEDLSENPKETLAKIEYDKQLYLWSYFFYSMTNKNITKLFFLKSFQKNLIEFEKMAFHVYLICNEIKSDIEFDKINSIELSIETQISELWKLKFKVNKSPKIIPSNEIQNIFKQKKNILQKTKKVLVVFILDYKRNKLFEDFINYINKNSSNNIEKIICIWLVNKKSEDIVSLEFDREKSELTNVIKNKLSKKIKIELIIKNINNPKDNEIRRNCYNALKNYKIDEIELVNDGINEEQLEWLLHNNKQIFINKNKNQYIFYNNN